MKWNLWVLSFDETRNRLLAFSPFFLFSWYYNCVLSLICYAALSYVNTQ